MMYYLKICENQSFQASTHELNPAGSTGFVWYSKLIEVSMGPGIATAEHLFHDPWPIIGMSQLNTLLESSY
jgi:hypothetical protein